MRKKSLSNATSVESDEFPDRFSDTWDRRSSAATRDHDEQDEPGLLSRLQQHLPCNRCWTSIIASIFITIFIVGGVLLIVALLVRHHDEQMEKLERSQAGVVSPPPDAQLNTQQAVEFVFNPTVRVKTVSNSTNCGSGPCLNAGTCLRNNRSAQCVCPAGITGRFCENGINASSTNIRSTTTRTTKSVPSTINQYCSLQHCLNGGLCSGKGECRCPSEFVGRYCQNSAKGSCASSPCMYNTICKESPDGISYNCTCPAGFSGKQCEQVTCGSNNTLTASPTEEILKSPDYPNDGLPALACSWILTARFFFIKIQIDVHLSGNSCSDSYLDVYDNSTMVLIRRFCPLNSTQAVLETHGSRSILIRYSALAGSFFRMAYSSPNIDPCFYFNKAYCTQGKCWLEETKAICVCDPCYRGVGCSEYDQGDCTDSYCENGGTCVYNCFVQTKKCQCQPGYDPKTKCAEKCSVSGC